MTSIELEPDLSTCIETLARREYERTLEALLGTEEESVDLAERLRTLRLFLESTDFGGLRGRYEPHLVEGRRIRFTLRPAGDKTEYTMYVSSD
jgi:hypothetical protein